MRFGKGGRGLETIDFAWDKEERCQCIATLHADCTPSGSYLVSTAQVIEVQGSAPRVLMQVSQEIWVISVGVLRLCQIA
jgi:hypothetical protein